MAETTDIKQTNNGKTSATSGRIGKKRPATRGIGGSIGTQVERQISIKCDTAPSEWKSLPLGSYFATSEPKEGIPLLLNCKVSMSAYVDHVSDRHNQIAYGNVWRVYL